MPTARSLLAALTLALTAISCSDKSPTEANNVQSDPQAPTAPRAKQPLIFTGPQQFAGQPALNSAIQVTQFHYNEATKQLTVDGRITLTDAATGAVVSKQDFTGWPATLTKSGSPTAPTCDILTLDIGAIHLDLLGLVVDLAPVNLDIVAQSGPGNLLGNLLCAVTNLLNGVGTGGGLGAAITNLLNQINALLAGLLG